MITCYKIKNIFFIFIILFLPTYSFSNSELSNYCNVDSSESLKKSDLSDLNKTEFKILEGASEGGVVEVYKKNEVLVAIHVTFLGETGKKEIIYYFSDKSSQIYQVELKDYNYTAPIYFPDSRIASITKNEFMVCGNSAPNYPNSSIMETNYNDSVEILSDILKSIY